MTFSDLPTLNAGLNTITTLFLLSGYFAIRRKKIDLHRFCMGFAFFTSVLFLISYLTYHYSAGVTKYQGIGWVRSVYFSVLFSHTFLAVTVPPLAVITVRHALKGNFDKHKRLARWTLPIWLYVSITGVVIYGMLYAEK